MNLPNYDCILPLLNEWRKLPYYQLERRADIFFALYLPIIWFYKFGCVIKPGNIIPEFPILLNAKEKMKDPEIKDLIANIDYVIFTEDKRVFFVELKTDISSYKYKQLKDMLSHTKISVLINNTKDIIKRRKKNCKNAEKRAKFDNLHGVLKINNLLGTNELQYTDNDIAQICYIVPNDKAIKRIEESIKPENVEEKNTSINYITFKEIVDYLKTDSNLFDIDPMMTAFCKALEDWVDTVNSESPVFGYK